MSYGSGNEWRTNADAYAKFRDENKWGNDRNLGYNARKSIRESTTRGFNDQGFSIGQGPDEIYYRMQKNGGEFTMDDVNDMITLGGKADKDGLVVVQNGSDYKTNHANNLFRDVQDMAKGNQHREAVKFSDEVTQWAASEREKDNHANRHIHADRARKNAEAEKRSNNTNQSKPAHNNGAGGTEEEKRAQREAINRREQEQEFDRKNPGVRDAMAKKEAKRQRAKEKAAARKFKQERAARSNKGFRRAQSQRNEREVLQNNQANNIQQGRRWDFRS